MSYHILNLEEKTAQLEKVAAIDLNVLESAKVTELRELAKGLIPNVSKLKKAELFDQLVSVTAEKRQELKAEKLKLEAEAEEKRIRLEEERLKLEAAKLDLPTAPYVERGTPEERAAAIVEALKDIAKTSADHRYLEQKVTAFCLELVRKEAIEFKPTTQKSNLTSYRATLTKAVKESAGTIYHDAFSMVELTFDRLMLASMSDIYKTLKKEYREKVEVYSLDREPVVVTPLLNKAEKFLKDVSAGESPDWRDVSIALALTTGRRLGEIHRTAKFEIVDCETVQFTGQLKTKERTDLNAGTAYNIPTLVDSKLVVEALKYLELRGKRADANATHKTVHDAYTKALSRKMNEWSHDLTYHSMRSLYATVLASRYKGSMALNTYMGSVLGHDPKDPATTQSYQKYQAIDL